jgi:hypothetical protein
MWNLGLTYRVATIGSLQTIWWKSLQLSSKIQEPMRLFFRQQKFPERIDQLFVLFFIVRKIRPKAMRAI